MRKITLFLCALLWTMSSFCQTWKYTANTSAMTATITGLEEGTSYSGPLNIPAAINYGSNVLKVMAINYSAFSNYSGITSVVIPEGVTEIGSQAFSGCTLLESVTIPSTMTSIGQYAFRGCTNLRTVNYNAKEASLPNVTYTYQNGNNYSFSVKPPFDGDDALTTINFGDSVKIIPEYLCYNLSGLTTVTMGKNVKKIQSNAFNNCNLANGLTLPSSLESIGEVSFYNCVGLPEIIIPEGVTEIIYSAFQKCTSLRKVTIPSTVTHIGSHAFEGCTQLQEVNYNAINVTNSNTSSPFANDAALTTFNFGANVETIPSALCENLSSLTTLSYGNKIKKIGYSAFSKTAITNFVIPEGATEIGSQAFSGCTLLESVTIPSTMTSIGQYAFRGCTNLRTVNYNAKEASLPNVTYTSQSSSGSTINVTPPFDGDDALTTINFGDGVKIIPEYLCYNLSGLTSLVIPDSVTSIGLFAFYSCAHLENVTFKPLEAPTCVLIFSSNSSLSTINIPCGYSYPSYASKLSSFTGILKYDRPSYTVSVKSDNMTFGTATMTTAPNCNTYTAELTATPKTGYHFVRWSDNVTVNPYLVDMSKDTTLKAFFEINKYTFKLQANIAARGTVSNVNGIYEHGSKISIEATPSYGYHFTQWSDGVKTNARTITLVKDSTITAIFDPNTYTITCGTSAYGQTTGAGDYDYLTEITLNATPNYGYKFQKWSDGNTANPRVVLVERDSTITAEYAPLNYQVVVKTADKKMGSVQPNSAEWPYLSQVELTAIPKYGYHFTEWSDGSNRNPHTITVEKDTVFTANFDVNTYTVTLLGSSYGTYVGAGTFDYLTDTQIEAIPNYGYKFKQWSDGVFDNPRILTVESDTTLSMEFEPVKFTLRATSSDDNMGSVTPSVGKYAYLSEVTITAEPEYGYHFAEWNDGRIANPRTIVIEKDTAFEATFEANSYNIQVTSSSMGKVSGAGEYDYLEECTLRATANYGYQFVSWKDGVTVNPRKFVVTQDSIFSAVYKPINFTIEAYSANAKQGSVVPETQDVPYMSIATITAVPAHGFLFSKWDDANTDNPRQITVTEDMTFIASFKLDSFNVVINESEYGYALGTGRYAYQSKAKVQAFANYGYYFVSWNDGITDNPRTINVEDNTELSMIFAPLSFTIRTQPNNVLYGTTSPKEVSQEYKSNLWITASAEYGYHFTRWNDSNENQERWVVVEEDKTYTAFFEPNIYTVTTNATPYNYGYVEAASQGYYQDAIQLEAIANPNYQFVRWSDGVVANPRAIVLTQDTSFTAEFAKKSYSVTTQVNEPTWGTASAKQTALYMDNVTISATPNYGYHFVRWSDGNTNNPRTITLTQDITLTAVFAKNIYTITDNSNKEQGSFSGKSQAEYLDAVMLTVYANYGYHFVRWSDGNTNNPRTITLSQDTTLAAEFAVDITGVCGDNNMLKWAYDSISNTLSISGRGTLNSNYTYGLQAPLRTERLLIEEGVTSIGNSAFRGFGKISTFVLPTSLKAIGDYAFKDLTKIKQINIPNEVETIGAHAFDGCIFVTSIYLGYHVAEIGDYAFKGCIRVNDITSVNTVTPIVYDNTLTSISQYAYLYVQAGSKRTYLLDPYWSRFDIKEIGAEESTLTKDNVVIQTTEDNAIFTWPTDDNAATYSLQITKDGEVFCTLVFNSNGQLMGIAFAPGIDGSHAPAATTSVAGMSFTVTGLSAASKYAYELSVADENNKELVSYHGEFATTGYEGEVVPGGEPVIPGGGTTAIDDVNSATPSVGTTKFFRNGQLFIQRGDELFNAQGARVK